MKDQSYHWFKGLDITHPHRHDVGLCGPVVIVEHHHSQHHTARHHHHDAVEVRAWTGKVTKYGAFLTIELE